MNCGDIDHLLADYLGHELHAARRAQFDAHLASCARCSAEVQELAKVQTELADLPEVSPSDAAWQTRRLEIRGKNRAARFSLRGRPRGLKPTARSLTSGLRYAAMLALGVGIGWQLRPGAEPPAPRSEGEGPAVVQYLAIDEVHPAWIEAAVAANRRYGGRSSFIRSLAALSSAGHKL